MKKIGYATGTRADYGIVKGYLLGLNGHEDIDLDILVTGTHLENDYGHTVDEIRLDGLRIGLEAPIEINTADRAGILNSMSICLRSFGEHFSRNRYDLVIILGDRYEMLMAAAAAAMNNTPILHLYGGEATFGNSDEFIRHSITKMSRYHFTSTDEHRKRVVQLGEDPSRVYSLGALGAENALLNAEKTGKPATAVRSYIVILFHPETATNMDAAAAAGELLAAVDSFRDEYDLKFIGNNADISSEIIRDSINQYCREKGCEYIVNLRNEDFHALLHNAACFVGNSSSGIIEAPSLGIFTVNIGDRQKGRTRGNSVIDVPCRKGSIAEGIRRALGMKEEGVGIFNPYYRAGCLEAYVRTTEDILRHLDCGPKEFFDIVFDL